MRRSLLAASCLLIVGVSLRCGDNASASGTSATPTATSVPLFDGLGKHTRKVRTSSPEAQRYFDQGLNFLYAFNHDEAIRSFRRAAELDPDCAMAYWGIAYANGPHINRPSVDAPRVKSAWEALEKARKLAPRAGTLERELIAALDKRYAMPQPEDRTPLDQAYADAMRAVWKRHGDDADVGAMFAESLMDLRPWDLWKPDGTPQPGTDEILATLEKVMANKPDHPLAVHLYIHAVEASPHPEKADAAADRLRDLAPGLGHMVHMPSHIDVRRGRWEKAAIANQKAMAADRAYREKSSQQNFYRLYMAHNHHMLAFASMMQGQSAQALHAVREMVAGIPEDWLKQNAFADGFIAMPIEMLVRFGRWDEVLAEPEPAEYLPVTRAMRHQARGVAYAAKGMLPEARAEEQAFLAARAKVPADATFGNNSALDLLNVAEHMLAGEILVADGKLDDGLARLRAGVKAEDALRYDEPPDWILPVRHALGAALVRHGRAEEAEQVYRDDLHKLPENGWSLYGLARSLALQKKDAEAAQVQVRFDKVWSAGDLEISSSCLCQPGPVEERTGAAR
ncbi:MAG: hypothetical protein KBD01_00320 [Acidobacteria bacterium]|nr:hypothetical protein [Acidobacteriota bacterium]